MTKLSDYSFEDQFRLTNGEQARVFTVTFELVHFEHEPATRLDPEHTSYIFDRQVLNAETAIDLLIKGWVLDEGIRYRNLEQILRDLEDRYIDKHFLELKRESA